MTPTTDSIKTLIDQSKDYLETRIELTKLKTIEKSAEMISAGLVAAFMLIISFLLIIFVSTGVALLVGKMLGAYHYGFFIMGGFYAIVMLIIYAMKDKWIKTPITNGLIHKMLK